MRPHHPRCRRRYRPGQRIAVGVDERLRHVHVQRAADGPQSPVRQRPDRHRRPVRGIGGAMPPCRHRRTRHVEDRRRVGGAGHTRPARAVGNTQRVAVVPLPRIREMRQARASEVGQFALIIGGHDRKPAAGLRGARLEHLLVHVAVRRVRRHAGTLPEPVMIEAHVVAKLVREGNAVTVAEGDANSARALGYTANVVGPTDDQVHEVGTGLVAQGVRLVQVTVRRIRETHDVGLAERLRIRHLGPSHQRHAVDYTARPVGLVGLGDHQVDLRLYRRSTARLRARDGRIDDGDIDRHVRSRSAQRPVEFDCRQPLLPSGRRTRLGHEDVHLLEI